MTEGQELVLQVLGRPVRLTCQVAPEQVELAKTLLEKTFRDMEQAYELRWGKPPSALDTSSWLLMGALNLAHQVVSLEREANQHTQDLEQTLNKLLDDVPDDELPPSGPLFSGASHSPENDPEC